MKQLFTFLAGILFISSVFAQSPEKMSYQAIIRNSNNELVANQAIGMQISILHGSADGTAFYVETQSTTTNANGLVSIEIGNGNILNGDFSTINWANGPYYIKTETDPTGGTNYTITGTSQMLSVPFALHAKTAENVVGTITEIDPVFAASQAANISSTDITKLNNLSGINTGDQDLSALATKAALADSTAKVRNEIPDVNGLLSSESDPFFASSQAANISSTDITKLNNLSGINTGDQDLSTLASKTALSDSIALVRSQIPNANGVAVNTQAIIDTAAQIRADIPNVSGFLSSETDPIYSASQAANITTTDITNLGNLSGTNTGDQDLSALATKTALSDSTAQVRSEIPDVSGFLSSESDPVYSASEAANISSIDITNLGNLSGTNTGDQDLSALATKTALSDSTAQVRSEIPDVSGFLSSESDPVYSASEAANISSTDITNLGNLSGTNTGDQDLSALATKTALSDSTAKVRSEIPDVSGFQLSADDGDTDAANEIELPAQIAGDAGKILAANGTGGVSWSDATAGALSQGKIYIGNASDEATEQTMTGDVTMDETGVTAIGSGKVTNSMLEGSISSDKLAGGITNAQLAGSITNDKLAGGITNAQLAGSITDDKLALSQGKIYVGNASGVAAEQTATGDVSIDDSGITTIGSGKVTNDMLAGSITNDKLAGGITNAQLAGSITNDKLSDGTYMITSAGTSGQVWTSDGSGAGAWATPSGITQWTTTESDIYYNLGKVGIGTTTPGQKLTVEGAGTSNTGVVGIDVTGDATFTWASTAMAPNLSAGNNLIQILGKEESEYNSGYIGFNYQGSGSSSNFLTFGLHTHDNLLNLTGAGNVGIGTTSPAEKLDVNGSIVAGSNGATEGSIILTGKYVTDDYLNVLGSHYADGGTVLGYAVKPKTGATGYASSTAINIGRSAMKLNGTAISFLTSSEQITSIDSDVSMSERFTILNNGNVGIGTTTPAYPLSVSGSILDEISAANYFSYGGGTSINSTPGTTISVSIYATNDIMTSGAFVAVSDKRVKENITELQGSLDLIKKLRPVSYIKTDKSEYGGKTELGFIAQEVEQVIPSAVNTGKGEVPVLKPFENVNFEDGVTYAILVKNGDEIKEQTYTTDEPRPEGEIIVKSKTVNDYKSLTYDMIFTVAVDAIQEQQAQIDELSQKVEELTRLIHAIQNK